MLQRESFHFRAPGRIWRSCAWWPLPFDEFSNERETTSSVNRPEGPLGFTLMPRDFSKPGTAKKKKKILMSDDTQLLLELYRPKQQEPSSQLALVANTASPHIHTIHIRIKACLCIYTVIANHRGKHVKCDSPSDI